MALSVPMSYSFGGLIFGGIGQDVQVTGVTGLRALPPVRTQDSVFPGRDGDQAGIDTLDERIITVGFQVAAPVTPFETVLAGIAAAFQPTPDPSKQGVLQFLLPTWSEARQVTARVSAADIPIDQDYNSYFATGQVQFKSADPLIYSSTLHAVVTGLPSPTAGLAFPATPNFVFGASTGGSAAVVNAGNYPTPPVFTITGPCLNPTITLGSMTMALNLTLGVSDVVVVDMGAKTVTFNGAGRQNAPQTGSSWFALPVGASSVGFQTQDSTSVAAQLTVAWRDAWGMV